MMTEVRFHGRGGQGVVSAARMVAEAAVSQGMYVQSFPEFGAERSGAPIAAYARISDEPIEIHSFIYRPNIVVVVDKSMAFAKSVAAGLEGGGTIIANYDGDPTEVRSKLGLAKDVKVYSVDATGVALKSIGKDYPNTPMLGALVRTTSIVEMEALSKVLALRFRGDMQAKNAEALRLGFEGVKAG